MKKKLPLILGITIPTCLVVLFCVGAVFWYNKSANNTTPDTSNETSTIEASTNETAPTETIPNESEASANQSNDKSNIPQSKEIKKFNSNVKPNNENNSDTDYSSELQKYTVYNNNDLGINYHAPDGTYIVPNKYVDEMLENSKEDLSIPFLKNSKIEFLCSSSNGDKFLCMASHDLDQNVTLDQLLSLSGLEISDYNLHGRNFKKASLGNLTSLYGMIGNKVIVINTTDTSMLSGF